MTPDIVSEYIMRVGLSLICVLILGLIVWDVFGLGDKK